MPYSVDSVIHKGIGEDKLGRRDEGWAEFPVLDHVQVHGVVSR